MPSFSNGQRDKKFFRKDYKYIEATESFYKMQTIPRTWKDAKQMCALEGARFFYPEDEKEAEAVLAFWKETHPFDDIFIGISDLVAKGVYETIDGLPIGDVFDKWDGGEPNNGNDNEDCVVLKKHGKLHDYPCFHKFPFICKKSLATVQWNQECNMANLDYKFNKEQSRCYKFHSKPYNWPEAHAVCNAEQSYLAVINSQAEAEHLVALTTLAPKYTVNKDFQSGIVLLGFHNRQDEGWETVRGSLLEDSGYTTWANGQPDGVQRGVDERCGSMFYNGHLNDIECDKKAFFICEHEVPADIDDRNGESKR
ncbi:unnamed protein product [Arctia plantaginis]|uniref:C-type lectin domain-containing protein n=1 Tax=Arctia plantaginis TaxID=874455 RepID=A0A8S1A7I0_ARCPL|nr:unnamed protein product [Arctia plantaginis]